MSWLSVVYVAVAAIWVTIFAVGMTTDAAHKTRVETLDYVAYSIVTFTIALLIVAAIKL